MRTFHLLSTTLMLTATLTLGCQSAPATSPAPAAASPAASDADRAFIDGMVPHHEMALMMADDALVKATHAELKAFAQTVKTDQNKEISEMKAWRQQWFGSAATPAMNHGDMMTIPAGADYDAAWAKDMIKHHQGAIEMAQTALATSTRAEVKALAQRIIDAQKAEQTQLEAWSRAWAR